jgi:hypothetical protein
MMAQMKYLSLTSTRNSVFKRVSLLLVIVFLTITLFGCVERNYPRHTPVFYINDYARALMEYTRQSVLLESEELYNTSENLNDGGAQLVVVTFSLKDESEVSLYDKTDLYREWEIGTNDMGILIILFFKENVVDGITYQDFIELQIEVGYRMETYLTPTRLGSITDQTFFNTSYYGDVNLGLMHLVYGLLEVLYTEVYGYENFIYDMALFEELAYDYRPNYFIDQNPISLWTYIESPMLLIGSGLNIYLSLAVFLFLGGGVGIFAITKGKGGSSGGMGIFRRRR